MPQWGKCKNLQEVRNLHACMWLDNATYKNSPLLFSHSIERQQYIRIKSVSYHCQWVNRAPTNAANGFHFSERSSPLSLSLTRHNDIFSPQDVASTPRWPATTRTTVGTTLMRENVAGRKLYVRGRPGQPPGLIWSGTGEVKGHGLEEMAGLHLT